MYSRWTQHLKSEEEKEQFRREVSASRPVLNRLKDIILDDLDSLDRSEIDPRTYTTPNWEFRQAHKNGMRQYIHQALALVDLDQQKGTTNDIRSTQ